MENTSKISRILIYISILSFIIWFGSYLSRVFVIYQLYDESTNLIFKNPLNIDLPTFIRIIIPVISINIFFYVLFLLSFFTYLLKSKIKFKAEGWLFITVIIISVTLLPELFLIYFDITLLVRSLSNISDYDTLYQIVIKRSEILGSFPIIELFLYLPVIYLILFKPLRLRHNEN